MFISIAAFDIAHGCTNGRRTRSEDGQQREAAGQFSRRRIRNTDRSDIVAERLGHRSFNRHGREVSCCTPCSADLGEHIAISRGPCLPFPSRGGWRDFHLDVCLKQTSGTVTPVHPPRGRLSGELCPSEWTTIPRCNCNNRLRAENLESFFEARTKQTSLKVSLPRHRGRQPDEVRDHVGVGK